MPAADETRQRIRGNPLATIADVRDAQRALALMEYLLTPVKLWDQLAGGNTLRRRPRCCKCRKPTTRSRSVYQIRGAWYCLDHIPTDRTLAFPIGLHGDEFKAYQERRK